MISLKLFHTDNISTRQKARAILKKEMRTAIARSQVVLYDKDNEWYSRMKHVRKKNAVFNFAP